MSSTISVVTGSTGPTGLMGMEGPTGYTGPTGPSAAASLAYGYAEGISVPGSHDMTTGPFGIMFKNSGTSDDKIIAPGYDTSYMNILVEDDYRIDFGISGSLSVKYTGVTPGSSKLGTFGITLILTIYTGNWTPVANRYCRLSSTCVLSGDADVDFFPDVTCNGSWIGHCLPDYKARISVQANYAADTDVNVTGYSISVDANNICYMNIY